MFEPNQRFEMPFSYNFQKVDKPTRIKLFKSIIDQFPKRYNNLKLIGAYLNWNADAGYDFFIAFETKNVSGVPFVLFAVYLFGDRHGIQGYYYCVTHDLVKEYFEDSFLGLVPLEKAHFDQIIQKLGLDKDSTSPNYWGGKENLSKLIDHLKNLSIFYKPQIHMT